MSVVWQLLFALLSTHTLCKAQPISGVKATFSNPKNVSQSFVALLSKPRVLTYNNRYDTDNPAWDCDFSQRNCYHWDEIHDWGTHNITITFEGEATIWETETYSTGLLLSPGSCADVFLNGSLVQSQCGYPMFLSGANASHIDWDEVKELGLDFDMSDLASTSEDVNLFGIAKNMKNNLNWVRLISVLNGELKGCFNFSSSRPQSNSSIRQSLSRSSIGTIELMHLLLLSIFQP
jgi:hypothetical protein